MKRIGVRFPNWHKQYVYLAPNDTEIGDVVKTPGNYRGRPGSYQKVWHGPALAEVVSAEDRTYMGEVETVLEVFRTTNRRKRAKA
jgi:hypothetical protein